MGPLCPCEDFRTRKTGARRSYSLGELGVREVRRPHAAERGETGGSLASHGGFITSKDKDDTGQRKYEQFSIWVIPGRIRAAKDKPEWEVRRNKQRSSDVAENFRTVTGSPPTTHKVFCNKKLFPTIMPPNCTLKET